MVTCINYAPPIKTQKYNETEKLSDAKKKNKKTKKLRSHKLGAIRNPVQIILQKGAQ